MAKKYPIDLTKYSKLKKRGYLTLNEIEQRLKDNGYDEDSINSIKEKVQSSQYIYGNFDLKKLIDVNKDLKIITSSAEISPKPKYQQIPKIKDKIKTFKSLVTNIKEHTRNKQTPDQLIRNAEEVVLNYSINPTNISTSLGDLLDEYENFKKIDSYLYYDTEVFGGINKYGKQDLLGMQEFTISHVDKNNGDPIVKIKNSILFGLDENNSNDKKIIDKINSWIGIYESTQKMPEEEIARITLDRLAKIGHSKTNINYDKEKGIAYLNTFASNEDIGEIPNIKLIKEGLARELKIGKFNNNYKITNEELGEEGIPNYIYTFYSMINDLNNNFTLGKNNIVADTKWINATSNDIYNSLTEKQINYLENKFGKRFETLTYNAGMIDQEAVFRAYTAINGTPYNINQLEMLNDKNLTQGKLESIGIAFYPELYKEGAAHSAIIDTKIGAYYASKSINGDKRSLMEKQLDEIKEKYALINRPINNKQDKVPVFLAINSDMYGRKDIDFTYNKFLNLIHFSNGLTVDEDGNVRNGMFSPGTKKGVSYTANIYEFIPTEEMYKSMQEIDYSLNPNSPLYMLELKPELNKTITKKNVEFENPLYRIFTSADEAEAYLSNDFLYYADKDLSTNTYEKIKENKDISIEAVGLINKATSIIKYENNEMIFSEATPEEIINKGTVELLNDSAVRTIRNEDYKKVEKYFNVKNYFKSKGVNSTGKVKDYLAAVTSLNISEDVAKGKDLTLDLQEIKSDLIKIIGYINPDIDDYDISPNTFRNFQTMYSYYSSYSNTLEDIYKRSSNYQNQQLAFQTYSRKLRNDIAEQIVNNPDLMKEFKSYVGEEYNFTEEELINGISNLKTFGFDTNFFEFNLPKSFFDKSEQESLRINLKPRKHYSLVKDLLIGQYGKNRYINMTEGEKENYGKAVLTRFINTMNHKNGTIGIFSDTIKAISDNNFDINIEDIKISNNDLAEMLFNDVRKFREENPFSGYKKDKKFMSALAPNYLINFAEELNKNKNINLIQESLNKTGAILSHTKVIDINAMNKESVKTISKDIVDSVMIKQLGIGDKFKDIRELSKFASKTYGFNENIFKAVVNKTYYDMQDIIKGIIEPILTRGGNILENDGRLNITFNNNDFLDITEYLPILQFNNGRLDTIVGNSTIMTGTRLDVLDAINYKTNVLDRSKVKFRSGLSIGKRNLRGLQTSIDLAIKNDNNPLDIVSFYLKNMDRSLRINPQSSRGNTISEMSSSVSNVNVEEVFAGLPYIYNEILSSDLFDDETKEILINAESGIKNGFLNSDVYQIIGRNLQNFIKFEMGINENDLDPYKIDDYFIKNLNLLTKDTAQAKFIYKIGENNVSALSQLSNYRRPVPIQKTNAKVYDKDKLSKYVETVISENKDNAFKNLFLSTRLTTYDERKRIERKFGKTNTTSVITGLKTNIDDTTFHKVINNAYNEIINNVPEEEKEKYEKVFNLLAGFSVYEGEKIINPNLGLKLFRNADTQYISIDKEIISTLAQARIDNQTNREIMDKQVEIIPFVKVSSNGVITFKYGDEVYIKKYDTILTKEKYGDINSEIISESNGYMKLRYYHKNSDIEVDAKDIEKEINKLGTMSKEDIFDYLNKKYTPRISIEKEFYKGFNKLYIDDEKGMARVAAVGAGFLDDRVRNVLISSRLDDKVNEIVKINFLEKDLKNVNNINEILKENNFNDINDFLIAVKNEQNFIVNNIFSKIPGFKDSIIFTNDNLAHHDNMAMYLKDMLDTAAYQKANKILTDYPNINREEAYKKAYGEVYETINMSKALWDFTQGYDKETGQIIFKSSDIPVLYKQAVKDLQKKLEVNETNSILYGEDGEKYSVSASRIMIAGPTEYAGSSNSIKEIKKIDDEIFELEEEKRIARANNRDVDYYVIARIKELRQKRYSLQNLNKHMTVDERSLNTLYNQKYTSPEEMKELKSLWDNVNDKEFNKLFYGLFDEDLNLIDPSNANVNKAIINNIESKIKLDDNEIPENNKRKIAYQLKQSNIAMKWNANPESFIDDSILKDNGFTEIDLNDKIFIPSGAGTPDLLENETSLLEKNLIINVNGRKIAIPYEEASIVGNQVINTEKNQKLRSVSKYNNLLNEAKKGQSLEEKPIEYYQTKLSESVNNLLNVLKENNNILDKDMKKVKLDGYTFSKLSGITYHKELTGKYVNDSFYNTATFAGKTLGELAEKGVYISAGKVGLDFFKEQTDLFSRETLKKLNMSKQDMIEYLQKYGTIGLFTRNPNVEKNSTSPMLIFLDENTQSKKLSLVSELLSGVNGDVDGDNGALALIKFRDHDYATAKLLSKGNLDDDWRNTEQAIAYTALPNSRTRKNVEKKLAEDINNAFKTVDDMFGEDNDFFFGLLNKAYDPNELKSLYDINNQITSLTINKLGENEFNKLNENETYKALFNTINELNVNKRNKAYEAISVVRSHAKNLITNISNSNKADIGFMDTPMNELIQLNKIINKDDSNAINAITAITKILREKPISRKKDDSGEVSITRKFREAWTRATNGSVNDASKVLSFIDTYKNDIVDFLRNNTTYPNNNTDKEAYEYTRQVVSNILQETRDNKNVKNALNGIRKSNYSNINNKNYYSENLPFGKIYAEMTNKTLLTDEDIKNSNIHPKLDDFKISSKKVLKESQEIIEDVSHGMSGIAIGALGLAAAIMVTGYVGGNPTKPADTQADEQNQNDIYDSLQDTDLQIQQLSQGTSRGYVININATSNKGRKHVQDAIQLAMQSSIPTDVNIQMNINDKTSNIDSKFIDKLLTGAL